MILGDYHNLCVVLEQNVFTPNLKKWIKCSKADTTLLAVAAVGVAVVVVFFYFFVVSLAKPNEFLELWKNQLPILLISKRIERYAVD